ncbi:hypothetical protein [Escherichia coli]|uniref:hypothetical protein n=1 Tax=Escherichia coli TaxID=562 RepID=UPI00203340A0|nr:hypothetical protein [Escherichia coli]
MIGWGVCVLALALADRYLLKRKDITHLELGDVEIKPGFIRVPFTYRKLKNQTIPLSTPYAT